MEFFAYRYPDRKYVLGVRFGNDARIRPIFLHEYVGSKGGVEAFARRLNDAVATWPASVTGATK